MVSGEAISQREGRNPKEEISKKESNLPLIQNSTDRAMSGFPDVKFVSENIIGVVCIAHMFE